MVTLKVNGITRTLQFFHINYLKITLTLFKLFELDFLAGCNGKGVIIIFFWGGGGEMSWPAVMVVRV